MTRLKFYTALIVVVLLSALILYLPLDGWGEIFDGYGWDDVLTVCVWACSPLVIILGFLGLLPSQAAARRALEKQAENRRNLKYEVKKRQGIDRASNYQRHKDDYYTDDDILGFDDDYRYSPLFDWWPGNIWS